jgi:DNA-binding NtrC family response regulator
MKTHILLIDDDEDEWEIFVEALNEIKVPFNCTYARGAEQAMLLLHYLMPDFIFVDFNMPKINGLKCLTEIKKIESMHSVPVILYSNFINDENFRTALILGAATCIKKPHTVGKLAKVLKDVLVH